MAGGRWGVQGSNPNQATLDCHLTMNMKRLGVTEPKRQSQIPLEIFRMTSRQKLNELNHICICGCGRGGTVGSSSCPFLIITATETSEEQKLSVIAKDFGQIINYLLGLGDHLSGLMFLASLFPF